MQESTMIGLFRIMKLELNVSLFKTFYVFLSIEREFKMHYNMYQIRKDSVQFHNSKQADIHS